MKKIITFLIVLLNAGFASAYQNVLIFSEEPVDKMAVQNDFVGEIKPFFTIMNERDTFLFEGKNEGSTTIEVIQKSKVKKMKVKVGENETKVNLIEGFDVEILDEAPEIIDFDEPPTLRKKESVEDNRPKLRGEEEK